MFSVFFSFNKWVTYSLYCTTTCTDAIFIQESICVCICVCFESEENFFDGKLNEKWISKKVSKFENIFVFVCVCVNCFFHQIFDKRKEVASDALLSRIFLLTSEKYFMANVALFLPMKVQM